MNIVDIMKSALERIAGIEMFHSLDVSMWNNLPLFTKICFVAAGPLLVLYIGLVIRGRLLVGMRGMLEHSRHYADRTLMKEAASTQPTAVV